MELAVDVPMSALALATVSDPVADINPAVNKLPPVILPVADIKPSVRKLPPCMLPVALTTPALVIVSLATPLVANSKLPARAFNRLILVPL